MKDDQKDFLGRLNIKKNELKDALNLLVKSQKEHNDQLAGDKVADESDSAQREMSAFSIYSLIDKKTRELKKIEYLIQKISRNEDFGICEECGEPIPTERLMIVPEANLCVLCQSEEEKFNRSRDLGADVSSGFNSKKVREWQDTTVNDNAIDGDIIDSELTIVSEDEMDSPDIPEPNKEFSKDSHSGNVRSQYRAENRV